MTEREPDLTIYTDGGADPNPGPGGWGAVLIDAHGEVREMFGGTPDTTNNRMELTAAQQALASLEGRTRVRVFTDSTYLRNGVTKWLPGWIRAGWKRKSGTLKNVDLWKSLAQLITEHEVDWRWLKGHAGHEWNERADALATRGIDSQRSSQPAAVAAPETFDAEVFLAVSVRGTTGAWSALVREGDDESTVGDVAYRTTSPRLEVQSATEALTSLAQGTRVAVYTRSDYLRNGAAQWLHAWKKRGWTTKAGQPVKNRDAWQQLDTQLRRLRVQWPVRKGQPPAELKDLERSARDRLA